MSLKGTRVERAIGDEPPSLAIISAVADATDTDPTELEPIYRTLDPDALNSLFETSPDAPWRPSGQVRFRFEGCDVVVHGDRKVVVKVPEADVETERVSDTR